MDGGRQTCVSYVGWMCATVCVEASTGFNGWLTGCLASNGNGNGRESAFAVKHNKRKSI